MCFGAIIWFFRCEIGIGKCYFQVSDVQIPYSLGTPQYEAIEGLEKAPCDLEARIRLLTLFHLS